MISLPSSSDGGLTPTQSLPYSLPVKFRVVHLPTETVTVQQAPELWYKLHQWCLKPTYRIDNKSNECTRMCIEKYHTLQTCCKNPESCHKMQESMGISWGGAENNCVSKYFSSSCSPTVSLITWILQIQRGKAWETLTVISGIDELDVEKMRLHTTRHHFGNRAGAFLKGSTWEIQNWQAHRNEGVQLESNTVTFFCAAKMQFIIATYSAGMSEDDLITCEGNMNLELRL